MWLIWFQNKLSLICMPHWLHPCWILHWVQRKKFVYLFEVLHHERVIIVQNRDPADFNISLETAKVFFCVLVVIKNLLKLFQTDVVLQLIFKTWTHYFGKKKHLNQFINIKFNFSLVFVQIAPVYEHLRFWWEGLVTYVKSTSHNQQEQPAIWSDSMWFVRCRWYGLNVENQFSFGM